MPDIPSASVVEVFRYGRRDEVRIYRLHVVAGRTELWRTTVRPGEPDGQIKEEDFTSAEVAAQYFDEIVRALTAGGWRHLSGFR